MRMSIPEILDGLKLVFAIGGIGVELIKEIHSIGSRGDDDFGLRARSDNRISRSKKLDIVLNERELV